MSLLNRLFRGASPRAALARRLVVQVAVTAPLLLAVSAGPAPAAEVAVQHVRGTTVLPAVPKTVAIFDLAALDTLDTLGVPVAGVPGGVKPHYLAKYDDARYRKIGTLFEPDYEALNALGPDLIVVGGRSAPKYDALAKMAPTVDLSSDNADILASDLRNVRALASIFGKDAEAEARIAKLEATIAAVRAKAGGVGTALFVLTTGGRMSAFGQGSRFGLLHGAFGFKPAAPDLSVGTHGQPISFEFIAKVNPDWLFVLDRDSAIGRAGQPAKQLLDNELVRQSTAWRTGQVVYVDPANWYLVGGGLTALQGTVDQVAAALDGRR